MLTLPANSDATLIRIADIDNLGRAEPPAQVLPAWVSPNVHKVPDLEIFLVGRRSRFRSLRSLKTINGDRLNERSERDVAQSHRALKITCAHWVFESLSHATVLDRNRTVCRPRKTDLVAYVRIRRYTVRTRRTRDVRCSRSTPPLGRR